MASPIRRRGADVRLGGNGRFVASHHQAKGYVLAGWSSVTLIRHELTDGGELKVTTFAGQGEYSMWLTRKANPTTNHEPLSSTSLTERTDGLIAKLGQIAQVLVLGTRCRCVSKVEERPTTTDLLATDELSPAPRRSKELQPLRCCAARGGRTRPASPRQIVVGRRGRLVPLVPHRA